jgi:outer membrane receptor for ferrienterochelin and colicins
MEKIYYILLGILIFIPITIEAQSQAGAIKGIVTSENQPVMAANVALEGIQKGAATDVDGRFLISNINPGTYNLVVSAVGFSSYERKITVTASDTVSLNIRIQPMLTELEEVVVTGTMKETFVKESPVKVNVVSRDYLEKTGSENLMESINYMNGLYQEVSCGVCGTNSVRINGMDGPYTAVLIDGMPIMGALASVYGLNGINQSIIRNIEIIKGPNSTLYGSEAMGGVINVLTRNPSDGPAFSVDAYASSHQETNLGLVFAPDFEGAKTIIGVDGLHFDNFLDHNSDGFADITKRKKLSLYNKWSFDRSNARTFDVAFKLYLEDRLGGLEDYTKELRGSDVIYGEAINTQRFEMLGRYDFPWDAEDVRAEFSYSYHKQDSYYGTYHYEASQQIYFTNLIWDKRFTPWRQLLIGATSRIDALDQTFDGIRLGEGSRDVRFIPGLFAQYEHIFSEHIKALAGMRVDHHENHGFIYSPRLNAKFDIADHTTLRLNGGTGFRIVNLFTEEHEALTGSRQVVIEEQLDPERSVNGTVNLNQIIDIGTSVLNVDLDLFYTHFSNQIIPDYSQSNEIRYHNLKGYSVSRGLSISAAHNFPFPLQYLLGFTVQDVFQSNNGTRSDVHFAPDWSGVFTASYTLLNSLVSIDYSGRIVGNMKLPEYSGYIDESPVFSEHNVRVSRKFGDTITGYISVKNLGNYTQQNPIIAPDRPFSDDFETDHVYGPLQTRRFLVGIQYQIK